MKSVALAFAVWLFSGLPVESHGICRVNSVQEGGSGHWWACGSCDWRGNSLLAAALLDCRNGECRHVQTVPNWADLGTCEKAGRSR